MSRLSNEQKIQKKINGMLTVEKLINHLKTFPKDTLVGKVGHFGEFNEMDESDFYARKAYITTSEDWRNGVRKNIGVVEIMCPDIGPDPD